MEICLPSTDVVEGPSPGDTIGAKRQRGGFGAW